MIKDTTQLQGFPTMKPPKIKGTVEIKLHNPTTGKTEVYKGENMVTNAIRDILASNWCGFVNYADYMPLWQKMYGGILCFNSGLNIDSPSETAAKDDYYIPNSFTHTVTAHAGQTAFTSQADDLTRGSPSDSNINVTDGIVTLAWEWGLSAGNGTIASLALTHKDVGDAGTGSASDAFKAMVPYIPGSCDLVEAWYGNRGDVGAGNPNFNLPLFVYDNYGYSFYVTPSSKTLNIVRWPLSYTKAGLVYNTKKNNTFAVTKQVTLGIGVNFGENTQNPFFYFDEDNVKLWIFYNTSATNKVYCEEINLSNWGSITTTNHDMTLNGVSVGPYNNYVPMTITVYNGYAYFTNLNNTNSYCKVQLSNTANITNLTIVGTNQRKCEGCFIPVGDNKILVSSNYVINNTTLYQCNSSNTGGSYEGSAGYFYVFPRAESKKGLSRLGDCFQYNRPNPFRVSTSKFYLGTKYNLSSPVQKTASQSMIITYTLQEVAPE